jgi:hypothetical protein
MNYDGFEIDKECDAYCTRTLDSELRADSKRPTPNQILLSKCTKSMDSSREVDRHSDNVRTLALLS